MGLCLVQTHLFSCRPLKYVLKSPMGSSFQAIAKQVLQLPGTLPNSAQSSTQLFLHLGSSKRNRGMCSLPQQPNRGMRVILSIATENFEEVKAPRQRYACQRCQSSPKQLFYLCHLTVGIPQQSQWGAEKGFASNQLLQIVLARPFPLGRGKGVRKGTQDTKSDSKLIHHSVKQVPLL